MSHRPADLPVVHPLGRSLTVGDGPVGVLLLHGWTGFTGRLTCLAESLASSGFAVHAPRLPGHGTNCADFLDSGAHDWYRRAVDAYLDFSAEHEKVHVAGTSMGAVLAAMLAARFHVTRLALLAPAFIASRRMSKLAPVVGLFIRRIRGDWDPNSEKDDEVRELGMEYSYYNYLKAVTELLKIQRWGRHALRSVTADTLIVVSDADPTVPANVAEFIERRIGSTSVSRVRLKESGHHVAYDVERDLVVSAVREWFMPRK
jgi:carboxylesterase